MTAEAPLAQFRAALGAAHVLTGADAASFAQDWTGNYRWAPACALRPGSTAEVAEVLRIAARHGLKVVPVGGNTGLSGGTVGEGAVMLSLARMSRIRRLRPEARLIEVEAGVILSDIHAAAEAEGLVFPLFFGARGSARIGGALSTNAGGSNVLRYGNVRALCLGLEVVLASGEVLDLMGAVHKDNSGYDLRDLFIGAEGTLGVITAAVLRLFPAPLAHATAMVAAPSVQEALGLLNRLQAESGGAVEAFEYMPRGYVEAWRDLHPETGEPFAAPHDVNLLVELGATSAAEASPDATGAQPVVTRLEEFLAREMEAGAVLDAVIARSEAQRRAMWARREAAAELSLRHPHVLVNDLALPLDHVPEFLGRALPALRRVDPGVRELVVAHLGDGNVHYNVWPSGPDPAVHEALREVLESMAVGYGGSFSAEHGVGVSKLGSMARHKDPLALAVMRRIRAALDPEGLLNPDKTLPPA